MMPVLEELAAEYDGRLHVEYINVKEHPARANEYSVRSIPTQIFLDETGNELFHHLGFISKEDILAKWAELGVNLDASPQSEAGE
jgi:thioredoxin 1